MNAFLREEDVRREILGPGLQRQGRALFGDARYGVSAAYHRLKFSAMFS